MTELKKIESTKIPFQSASELWGPIGFEEDLC